MAIIAKLEGIKSMAVDMENGTLTVVGTVDPVCIIVALRKKKWCAKIVTVELEKKDEEKPKEDPCKKIEECKKLLAEAGCPPPCLPPVPYVPYRNVMVCEDPTGCIIS